jgi:hypothetical protein
MTNNLGFIDPTFSGGRSTIAMAPRPMDLAGKVVALLCNTKEQAELILQTVGTALCERYGVARVVLRSKETFTRPAKDELINEMAKEAHVAVAGLGG